MNKDHKFDNLLIIGRNPVKEAIVAKRVVSLFISDSFNDKKILALINENKLSFKRVSNSELDALTNQGTHQGIIAKIKPYEYHSLQELLSIAKKKDKTPIIVILDGICDPQNMGAIMRSCDVFDVTGVIISKHNQVPLNSTVAKTSAGAINYIPVCLVNNINQTLDSLKKEGFWIVASDGSATQNYQDLKYDFPVALVVGSEGFGVSQLVIKNSDFLVKIPQFGHVNSLNASVAAGILLAKIRS